MKFIDRTEIHVTAGNGGDGMVSFRTARNMAKLGPDGGNGGHGGHVELVAKKSLNTLSSLRYRHNYKGEHGGKGGTNDKTGRCGSIKKVFVPCGTVITDRESGETLAELLEHGQSVMVAKGGNRGYGNAYFTTAENRAPRTMTHGKKGENRTLQLELKLLADVGLAGFPNAGKSTLLSSISAARPKVANYPFTTLTPQLGVVDLFNGRDFGQSFVVADIPGLIEGASEGRGLGHDFLRHLERTKLTCFVLDSFDLEGRHPYETFKLLKKELDRYSPEFNKKRALIVLNKMDLAPTASDMDELQEAFSEAGYECFQISAASQQGVQQLKMRLYQMLQDEKRA